MSLVFWNCWHGCTKISPGCQNCYVYRIDHHYGRDPKTCKPTGMLKYPIAKNRKGEYKLPQNSTVMCCFTSDFLLKDADAFRDIAWDCIRERKDCTFQFITKRIDRLAECLPEYWDEIKDRVTIHCTVENQEMADYRLPIFFELPIMHRYICVEPILEEIDLSKYLKTGLIEHVTIGGESGPDARVCDFNWVNKIIDDCEKYNVKHWFKQTGARFLDPNGNLLCIARKNQFIKADEYGLTNFSLKDDI